MYQTTINLSYIFEKNRIQQIIYHIIQEKFVKQNTGNFSQISELGFQISFNENSQYQIIADLLSMDPKFNNIQEL